MYVSCVCCVGSERPLRQADHSLTGVLLGHSFTGVLLGVSVCVCVCVCVCDDLETSRIRRPRPELDCCAAESNY
jgi:hypothetical protein